MSEPTTRRGSTSTSPGNGGEGGSDSAAQPFASLMIKDVDNSVIVAGHVDGPVHVTGVRDSVVVVAARQVRVHECERTTFYLHVGSRPIIEDCKGVRFGRAPGCYVSLPSFSLSLLPYFSLSRHLRGVALLITRAVDGEAKERDEHVRSGR